VFALCVAGLGYFAACRVSFKSIPSMGIALVDTATCGAALNFCCRKSTAALELPKSPETGNLSLVKFMT
jgi:hypothetical protein